MAREVLTPTEMYQGDALAIASGTSEAALIERAGRAAAEEIVRRYGARKTVVLCGPGNNGKDGAVAARYLSSWGWPVSLSQNITSAELIVDALYGAGLNRDFPADIAERVNSSAVPVVAIDVPSGLDGLTGHPRGSAIKADLTITFFRKKPAHLLHPGRALCGEIIVHNIGIPDAVLSEIKPQLRENGPWRLPVHAADKHKFRRGHAVVWSGPQLRTGAARLAAMAAARSGAGLVTLAGDSAALAVHASHVSSIMLQVVDAPGGIVPMLVERRANAFCIGPAAGVGEVTRANVLAALASDVPVVLDADALTSFEGSAETLFNAIKRRLAHTVLTPHEGEFRRLFSNVQGNPHNKVELTRAAAKLSGAVVLYKGPDTVIADPAGQVVINGNGSSQLAVAGSGDVLAGLITGLLAQGMNGFDAACAAAWLHGEAGNRSPNPTAEDLVAAL